MTKARWIPEHRQIQLRISMRKTNHKGAKHDFKWFKFLNQTLSLHFTFTRGSSRFAEDEICQTPFSPRGVKNCRGVYPKKSLFTSNQYLPSEGWQSLKPHSCHILLPFCLTMTSALLWPSGHKKFFVLATKISYTGHTGQFHALRRRQRCSGLRWIHIHPTPLSTESEQEFHFMHSQSLGAAFPLLTCTWFLPNSFLY